MTIILAGISTPPRMMIKELRVQGSVDTDDFAPTTDHYFVVHGFMASMLVPSSLTSTLRATMAFGTGHTTDTSKIIASFRTVAKDTIPCACLSGINVVGEVNEIIRLTNMTYSVGDAVTRSVIYYTEVKV